VSFIEWGEMVSEIRKKVIDSIEKYELLNHTEKLVVLFSAGKDATFALYEIVNYIRKNSLKIDMDVILVTYPLHVYFDVNDNELEEFRLIKKFWAEKGVNINYIVPNSVDFADNDKKGCQICKKSRKLVVDDILRKYEKNVTIMTGYTLFDILAYFNIIQLTAGLQPNICKGPNQVKNFIHKMHIKEYLPNGNTIIRPLLDVQETEIKNYLNEREIPYITTECKIAKFKFKRLYFEALSILDEVTLGYEDILKFLNIESISKTGDFSDISNDQYFIDC